MFMVGSRALKLGASRVMGSFVRNKWLALLNRHKAGPTLMHFVSLVHPWGQCASGMLIDPSAAHVLSAGQTWSTNWSKTGSNLVNHWIKPGGPAVAKPGQSVKGTWWTSWFNLVNQCNNAGQPVKQCGSDGAMKAPGVMNHSIIVQGGRWLYVQPEPTCVWMTNCRIGAWRQIIARGMSFCCYSWFWAKLHECHANETAGHACTCPGPMARHNASTTKVTPWPLDRCSGDN